MVIFLFFGDSSYWYVLSPLHSLAYLVCMTFSLKPIASFYLCFIFFTIFTLFFMTPTEVSIVSIPLWDPYNIACISWKVCIVFFFSIFIFFVTWSSFSLDFLYFFISCSWIEVFALYFCFVVSSNGVFNLDFLPDFGRTFYEWVFITHKRFVLLFFLTFV